MITASLSEIQPRSRISLPMTCMVKQTYNLGRMLCWHERQEFNIFGGGLLRRRKVSKVLYHLRTKVLEPLFNFIINIILQFFRCIINLSATTVCQSINLSATSCASLQSRKKQEVERFLISLNNMPPHGKNKGLIFIDPPKSL
jgi:hypothetical protein